MTEIITEQVRAKAVYVDQERVDKAGRVHTVRNHIIPSMGMHSGREAERMAVELADELGVDEGRVHVDMYDKGKAPIEANPRHRGLGDRWDRPRHTERVTRHEFQRVRNVFAGMHIPSTPEEWAEYHAEFERRRAESLYESNS